MSLNQILENTTKRLDIVCDKLDCNEITGGDTIIDELSFKAQNGDVINLSSLPDKGTSAYRLTSDGDGTLSWVAGAGISNGVEYNGTVPVSIGKLAIYGGTDGNLIKDSSLSDTDILNKNGDTMAGNLDMGSNDIDSVGNIEATTLDGVQLISGTNTQDLDLNNAGFNIKIPSCNLDLNNNSIENVFRLNVDRIKNPSLANIDIENDLFLRDNNITKVANINVDTFSVNTLPAILFNDDVSLFNNDIVSAGDIKTTSFSSTDFKTNDIDVDANLDLQTTRNIKNVNILQTNEIAKTSGVAVVFDDDINMSGVYDIYNCNQLRVSSIAADITPDINIINNLVLNNNNIDGVNNITTTDINTDTISANAPATEIKLGPNTDLNLDGNSIIGLELINGIQPSGGVYSNPTQNNYAGSTAETDILTGTEYGSKTIPADNFVAGSLYSLKIGGEFDATNNDVFTIRVVSNFGLGSEAEFVNIPITITDTNLTNRYFELEIDFAVRSIGIGGAASIITNGSFDYYNTNNLKKGTGINNINNTTFNTEIDNTLSITYATTDASVDFTCDIATITKFY